MTQTCRTVKLAHSYDKQYLAESDSNVKKIQNGGEAVKGRSKVCGEIHLRRSTWKKHPVSPRNAFDSSPSTIPSPGP